MSSSTNKHNGNNNTNNHAPTRTSASLFNDFLLKSNPEWDRLLVACQKDDVDLVQRLIEEDGVDPSHCNPAGQSALHIAAWWAHVECLQILLEYGANVHAANSLTGATPLHGCFQSSKASLVKSKRLQCIELLVKAGADLDVLDHLGRKPLDYLSEDDTDRKQILEVIQTAFQQENQLIRALVDAIHHHDGVLSRIDQRLDQCWKDIIESQVDDSIIHLQQQQQQQLQTVLSSELLTLVEEWIEEVQKVEDKFEEELKDGDIPVDHEFYVFRVEWIWRKLKEQQQWELDEEESNENNNSSSSTTLSINSARQKVLDVLCTAILHRYGHVHKKPRCTMSLLEEDAPLSSWTQAAVWFGEKAWQQQQQDLALAQQDIVTINTADGNVQQAWMTIARRNYFRLAEYWWDELGISPIGVVNRQGMSPLQFAARSGHIHLVQWFLQHLSMKSITSNACDNANMNNKARLLDWVQQQDQLGHTALTSAQVNQHDEIARILEEFVMTDQSPSS
jgi:ankyrin repeat protein